MLYLLYQVKEYFLRVEEAVSQLSAHIEPYLPAISRFLIVITFYEDAARLVFQWSDQNRYLTTSLGFPTFTSEIFLFLNIVTMLVCATLATRKEYIEHAIGGLLGVVISQWLGYGMFFNLKFILYNFSIVGGLLLLYVEHILNKNNQTFAGLLNFTSADNSIYVTLAGRILLIFLFLAFCFAGEMTFLRVIVCGLCLLFCVMAAAGFNTKFTAIFTVLFLCFMQNLWGLHHDEFVKDHIKYDFFQTLSTVGGFLLLASA